MERNTLQKAEIMNSILKLSHPTMEEIYQKVSEINPKIGIATIYRNVNNFVEKGKLIRIQTPNGYHYDFTTINHYHLYCNNCKNVVDVNINYLEELNEKVSKKSVLEIVSHDILFTGKCKSCMKNQRVK